ncbi:MAG: hypothetical protein WDA75_10245 [Candidatus Latescibacterota bacterium]|jgi:hypothetical protein
MATIVDTQTFLALLLENRQSIAVEDALAIWQRVQSECPSIAVEFNGAAVNLATHLSPPLFQHEKGEIRRAPTANGLFSRDYLTARYYSAFPANVTDEIRSRASQVAA